MTEYRGNGRALETTDTEGTDDYELNGVAGGGYLPIVDAIGDGNGSFFVARSDSGVDAGLREIFWGTVAAGSPNVVERTAVIDSDNSNLKIDWNAGTKTIYSIAPDELVALIANVGYAGDGMRPALITLVGRGLWIDGNSDPRIWYFYNGTVDIPLLKIDETGGVVSLVGSGAVFTSIDAGAGAGPDLELYRDSASPAASDKMGRVVFSGNLADTGGTKATYGEIQAEIVDPGNSTDGLPDGALGFRTLIAGVLTTVLRLADRLTLFRALETAKGAAVASAATCDIWTPGDGNLLHITGTTGISSFGTAPQAGATRELIFDGALTITAGANLVLNGGGSNVAVAAGDRARVRADTTTKMVVDIVRASGKPLVASPRQYLHYQNQQASGGSGPTYSATTQNKVTLNTEVVDTDGNGALSASVVTLEAGTYVVHAVVPYGLAASGASAAQLRLRDTANNVTLAHGVTVNTVNSSGVSGSTTAELRGRFTLAAQTTVELQIYTSGATSANAPASSGEVEVYADLFLEKVA